MLYPGLIRHASRATFSDREGFLPSPLGEGGPRQRWMRLFFIRHASSSLQGGALCVRKAQIFFLYPCIIRTRKTARKNIYFRAVFCFMKFYRASSGTEAPPRSVI
jgi:hypothetical protein